MIALTTSTSGASINYTTDGSTPSDSAGILYTGPITISSTTTVKAIAYASGMDNSPVSVAVYNIVTVTPNITAVTPAAGQAGTTVTIAGTGFGSVQGTGFLWLGSTLGVVVSWNDTQITATVATNSTSGTVQVQQLGAMSNSVPFSVNTATVSTVAPASGVPGTSVTITGSGFGAVQGTGQVLLGTAAGTVQSWNDTQIVALVTAGSHSGNAQVLQAGVWSNPVPFTVNTLHIDSTDPTSGTVGASVTLTGTGFGSSQGSGAVILGSAAGSIVSWSDTQVVATVASAAVTGVAKVQQNGVWSNALAFSVLVEGVPAQTLVPNALTMMVGETHAMQALDSSGQSIAGLTWTSSDTSVVSLSTDDPPILTALAAGHATITAGNASADVTVSADPLPLGTILWSNPGNASGVSWIVPAVPSPSGVADVFAFQGDGTVQAITADGATAWTADVSQAYRVLPDFQGGLVTVGPGATGTGSISRLDGMTGQATWTYTAPTSGGLGWNLALHTDGTVFAIQYDYSDNPGPPQVIGLDGTTGSLKFSVPWPYLHQNNGGSWPAGPIIAGDGNAYLAYTYREFYSSDPSYLDYDINHLVVLRVGSDGSAATFPVYDWVSGKTISFRCLLAA